MWNHSKIFFGLFWLAAASLLHAADPAWWAHGDFQIYDASASHAVSGNYTTINIGQLKNVAQQADNYFNRYLPGQAGSAIDGMVSQFYAADTSTNYAICKLGQLKAVAKLYYDRLDASGYDTKANLVAHGFPSASLPSIYPWDPATPTSQNYSPANLGQLKQVFSFDLFGHLLLDYPFQQQIPVGGSTNISVGGVDTNGDPLDLSGVTWSVSGGGTISGANGTATFSSSTPGTYTVTATLGSMSVHASVTVYTPILTSLSVSPTGTTIPAYGSADFSVSGADQYGNEMNLSSVAWSVDAGGTITSPDAYDATFTSNGTANSFAVTASVGSVHGVATVAVYTPVLTSIYLSPPDQTTPANSSVSFTAYGSDQYGAYMNVSSVAWTVDHGGTVSAVGDTASFSSATADIYTVTASLGLVNAVATVTVYAPVLTNLQVYYYGDSTIAPYGTQYFSAYGTDQYDNFIDTSTLTWNASAHGVMSGAGSSSEFISDGTSGPVDVSATNGTVTASTRIYVGVPVLTTLQISPNDGSPLAASSSRNFTVSGQDQFGQPFDVSGDTFTWSVSGSSGGSVVGTSASATYTAGSGGGSVTITAAAGSIMTSATFTVYVPILTSLSISPYSVTIGAGSSANFSISGYDQYGHPDTSGVTTSVNGGGTAAKTGDSIVFTSNGTPSGDTTPFVITATSGTVSATASVYVYLPVVAAITVSPDAVEILPGATTGPIVASLVDQYNAPITSVNVTWSVNGGGTFTSSAGNTATFTSNGTGGTYSLTATANGENAAASIVVYVPSVIRPGFVSDRLVRNDDESTGLVSLGFSMNLFGSVRNAAFINNNGNITFDHALGTFSPAPLQTLSYVMIAPFWADVDTRPANFGITTYGPGTVDGHAAFGVNYLGVGYFSVHTDKLNSLQMVLINRDDTGIGNADIEFNYSKIVWETGDASGGIGGLGGFSARAGITNGSNKTIELPGSGIHSGFFDSSSTALIHNSRNSGLAGRYLFQVRGGEVLGELQVDAGADQTLSTSATMATLSGTASDAGGGTITTTWTVMSKPSSATVTFANIHSLNTTVTLSTTGTYVLELTATNSSASITAADTVTIIRP